jgi:hypothetical protein
MYKEYVICMDKKEKTFYNDRPHGINKGVGINNARRCSLQEIGFAKSDVQRLNFHFMKFDNNGKLIDVPFSEIQNR